MTQQLVERIINHDAYTKTDKIIQLLEIITENDIPSEQVSTIERLSETINILKEAFDRVDPWLLSSNTLQTMNSHITNIQNDLTNYNNNKNIQHLTNANSRLEQVLPFFSEVMITRTPEDIEGVKEAVVSFRKSIAQHLSNVEKHATATSESLENNKEKLIELTTSIESHNSRTDSVITDFQDKFLKGQTERNEKIEQLLEQSKIEFNNFISSGGTTFEEQMNKQQEEHELQINKNEIEFDEQITQQEKILTKEHEKIITMNKEAEKILGIMSMKGLARGYQKIADDEGKKAFRWNMGSLISMLGVIGLAIWFILLYEGTMTWTDLVSRIVLTGVGITLFTYCAKQATNHREEERRNRKIELELASLDPYLKDMEEELQKEVKQSLVNKYFGVELPSISGKQSKQGQNIIDSIINNPQLIQILVERVSQNMKK